jgi:two-component sensor histidine kinase
MGNKFLIPRNYLKIKTLLIFLFFSISFFSFSQEINVNDIKRLERKLLFTFNYDSLVDINLSLFNQYSDLDQTKANVFLEKYYELAKARNDEERIAIYNYLLILNKFNEENYQEVDSIYSLVSYKINNPKTLKLYLEATQLQMRALNFLNQGKKAQKIGHSVIDSKLYEDYGMQLAKINLYLGQSYLMTENDSAIYYLKQASNYLPNYPNRFSLHIFHAISEFYSDKEKLDSALFYAKNAYELSLDSALYADIDYLLPAYNYYRLLNRAGMEKDAREIYQHLQIKRYSIKRLSEVFPSWNLKLVYLQNLYFQQKIYFLAFLGFSLLLLIGLIFIYFYNNQLKKSYSQNKLLLFETNHRVKNNFQMMMSILNVKSKELSDNQQFVEHLRSKISSMAKVHELFLINSSNSKIDSALFFNEIINSLKDSLSLDQKKVKILFEGGNTDLPLNKIIVLGQIINELVTNSIKHSLSESLVNEIKLSIRSRDSYTLITYHQPRFILNLNSKNKASYGLEIVHSLIKQLPGIMDISYDQGMTITLSFKS